MTAAPETTDALVIGAGPAGLMAADVLSEAGLRVIIAEAKPSPARKFLMAGKSGLNLTKDEPLADFLKAYGNVPPALETALRDFGPDAVKKWAVGLDQSLFTGSSGRVFPEVMKASPLLRAWLTRLGNYGVELRRNWRWTVMSPAPSATSNFTFETPGGPAVINPKVTILALGGASWSRLGSDGAWTDLVAQDADLAPFVPSNVGLHRPWSDHMAPHFGKAIKPVAIRAGAYASRGEFVLSQRGLEGGGIYAVIPGLREGADLRLDLLPDWPKARVEKTLIQRKKGENTTKFLKRAFRLPSEKIALIMELARPLPSDLTSVLKDLHLTEINLRPMDEAISTAGGVTFESLTDHLEFATRPGLFAAGEMLDWDAPTGGYLLTACLATGRLAARGALIAAGRA